MESVFEHAPQPVRYAATEKGEGSRGFVFIGELESEDPACTPWSALCRQATVLAEHVEETVRGACDEHAQVAAERDDVFGRT